MLATITAGAGHGVTCQQGVDVKPSRIQETIRGTPIAIDGRTFVPEARVTTWVAHEATFQQDETRLVGVHMASVRPTALIEDTPRGERRYRVRDRTRQTLLGLAMAAFLLPLVLNALASRLMALTR